MPTSRRHLLGMATAGASAWPLLNVRADQPSQPSGPNGQQILELPQRLHKHMTEIFGNTDIPLAQVSVSLPALAENGNSVALGVSIKAAENPSRWLDRLYVFAEKNPLPDILRCTFPAPAVPQQSRNQEETVSTRIRLSDSQRIIAVAQFNDGSLVAGEASIVVTLAACIDLPV